MRIGIDTQSACGEKTGIGYYVQNLLREYILMPGMQCICYNNTKKSALNTLGRLQWENISLPSLIKKKSPDLLHIPGFAGPRLKGRLRRVTTVHDLIGMIFPQNLACVSRFYWQRWLPACVKNSDLIIADSENTKPDIVKLLGVSPERIRVIYLAADPLFCPIGKPRADYEETLRKYGIDKKYILNTGTIEPRKNVGALIEAFARYVKKTKRDDLQLVIAGKMGWDYPGCRQKALESGVEEKIIFCGYVKDEELDVLYNFAEVFVYPSFYEGFGLPVVEAMSCGVAVICSNVSSLPEIAAGAAGLVNPNSADSIEYTLSDVLEDNKLRKELSRKSLIRAKSFSWSKTAQQTRAVYQEVLG